MAKTSQKPAPTIRLSSPRGRKTAHKPIPNITKVDTIINLLKRIKGASLIELMTATSWQQHSLRGFLVGAFVKRDGLTIRREKVEGERRYRIVKSSAAS
jgi:Protein of unknown function (DUF3489)